MTDATGSSTLMKMNDCVAPLGVSMETSAGLPTCAALAKSVSRIASRNTKRDARGMVNALYVRTPKLGQAGSDYHRANPDAISAKRSSSFSPAILDGDRLILDPAEFAQPLHKSVSRRPLKRRVICSQKPE